MKTSARIPDLPKLAERLLETYNSDEYKQHRQFEFIDHLRPEKDPIVTSALEELLLEALRAEDLGDIHLAAPEPLDWSAMDGFRFSTQPTSVSLESDPRITTYLETKQDEELTKATLTSDKMFALSSTTNLPQG